VAVIGAGTAGLAAARVFSQDPNIREVKVFECREDIGGQWLYNPCNDADTPEDDLHKQLYGAAQCSMYEDLYCNMPSQVMNFLTLDGSFTKTYCHRREVFNYLKEYAQHYDLDRLIAFNTAVTLVEPISDEEFRVTTRDKHGSEATEVFNRVAVCKGNFSVPYVPSIEGAETFTGRISKYKDFKIFNPEEFEGKVVVVIGGGLSSGDALQSLLVKCSSSKVLLTANKMCWFDTVSSSPSLVPYAEQLRLVCKPSIKAIHDNEVEFVDGSRVAADEIILCTGYIHKFPFLPHQLVSDEGRYVENLYKGIIDIQHPRIAHIGLYKGSAMPRVELAAKFVLKQWLGTPDVENMRAVLDQDEEVFRKAGIPLRKVYSRAIFHFRDCFAFFRRLGVEVDPEYEQRVVQIWDWHLENLKTNCLAFKGVELSH